MNNTAWDGVFERLRMYLLEQTGLPAAHVDALLDAQREFWEDRPEMVADMIEDEDDE